MNIARYTTLITAAAPNNSFIQTPERSQLLCRMHYLVFVIAPGVKIKWSNLLLLTRAANSTRTLITRIAYHQRIILIRHQEENDLYLCLYVLLHPGTGHTNISVLWYLLICVPRFCLAGNVRPHSSQRNSFFKPFSLFPFTDFFPLEAADLCCCSCLSSSIFTWITLDSVAKFMMCVYVFMVEIIIRLFDSTSTSSARSGEVR